MEVAVANFGQDSSFAGNKTAQNNTDANGYGDFYYPVPSGFLSLCSQNLPSPAVVPGENFNTVLYTGNGSTQSITGVGFQPDLVWGKSRTGARSHMLFDVIRGPTYRLASESTTSELAVSDSLTSFDSDGFSVGAHSNINTNGEAEVAWNWKADNTSGSTNNDGSITSTVAANPDAGFSIVSYTGTLTAITTSTAASVGHGLSSPPDLIITKRRSAAFDWDVRSSALTSFEYRLKLNSTATPDNLTAYPTADPTSSVFYTNYVSTQNVSGEDFIAYCFHSVDGYSKFGEYTANATTDNAFVYCGFRPAFILTKRYSSSSDWFIHDYTRQGYNPENERLRANTAEAEATTNDLDILSNGFKIRNSADPGSSGDHIFMAFAEYPFKYTTAR